jgi:membrane protease YdiL (CAAX protease family)
MYSYQHSVSRPWGFGIVIIGFLVSGYGYLFYIPRVTFFSINLLFLVSLFGLLLNVNNIREQFCVRSPGELLRFLAVGLTLGLVLGFSQRALLGIESFRMDPRFSPIAMIATIIQVSIAEEILHRGYFLGFLRKFGFKSMYAIVFQSLIFAATHVAGYSGNWVALGNVFLVGFVANYLTWKNNNLIPAIILHLTGNLMGIVWWLITT